MRMGAETKRLDINRAHRCMPPVPVAAARVELCCEEEPGERAVEVAQWASSVVEFEW